MIGPDFPSVLAGAQLGDHRAIETIYRDCAPLVLGYLRSNGAFDADDIASEVFVSMIKGIGSFSGDEQKFRSWLLTIAHRRLIDAIRRSGRRLEDPAPVDEMNQRAIVLGDTEHEAMNRLRSVGVLEALDRLTDDQRAVLTLRVLADLPIAQIADIVGKPESAVKALLRRGLAALARTLGDAEPGPGWEDD